MRAILITLALFFVGCDNGAKGTLRDGTSTFGSFQKCEFEGHDYLIYNAGHGRGLEHDPECRKCIAKQTNESDNRR